MAEIAVSFVLEAVFPLLIEEVNLLRGVHKNFADIKDELESMKAFLKDADRRAATEGDVREGIRIWVKQLREAAFRIEDLIDEYLIYVVPRPHQSGFAATLYKVARRIKTVKPRHQIAREIQDIKSLVHGIQERRTRYGFEYSFEQGSSSSKGSQNVKPHDPRMVSHFTEEANVVGFEGPRDELIGWLTEGTRERAVISVVGMGGLGKTTLAKMAFDSEQVRGKFDCHACITVSQSYTVEGLLRDMMEQFYKETREPLPQNFHGMDPKSLTIELRHYLQQKRYVVFFDDVWKVNFWDEIELSVPENNKGSRIIITTRNMAVANYCKKSSLVHVHKLQHLPHNKASELFRKKAFRFEFEGHCPKELADLSNEIVRKCEGLPLAIVAIAGLLSTKTKTLAEWRKLLQGLRSELENNPHLTSLTKILALSYDDLPYNLKSCFLYFGIYPEDYSIKRMRLIRQWIAEGFVKHEEGKTLEEVADGYLTELTSRSLVQVYKANYRRNSKSCRVHDLLREMIIRKMKDLCFGCFVHEDDQSISNRMTRRLSMATNFDDVLMSVDHTSIRSIYIFQAGKLPKSFVSKLVTKSKLLKILDFESVSLDYISGNLGNLAHLRYLNLRKTGVQSLPKSIGELQNLETLDLRETMVCELPIEIKKLTKLRHLLVYHYNYDAKSLFTFINGAKVKEGIGCLKSLQKLYRVEANLGGLDLIMELRQLRQLRSLGLDHVRREYGNDLCSLIEEMKHLESLSIVAIAEDEIIDLQYISSPPQLRKLYLGGCLEKLPNWVLKLQYLVRLIMVFSKLTVDPLESLKNLPNLLTLWFLDDAYDGETLHFQGGFQKLKDLQLRRLKRLNSIIIDKGALPVLEQLEMWHIPQLKEVPSGIHHSEKLQFIEFIDMPQEFNQSIDPDGGQMYWTIKHVPLLRICDKVGPNHADIKARTILRHSSHS